MNKLEINANRRGRWSETPAGRRFAPIGNCLSKRSAGFTLIELVLVMIVLTTVLAFVAPMLTRSFQQRHLDQEATRLVSLTEYGRDEAISQGVPMVVWINPETGDMGLDAATGYTATDVSRKQYSLNADLHFDMQNAALPMTDGLAQLVQFAPDGSPDTSSGEAVRIVDRFDSSVIVRRTEDGWGYEVAKEEANVARR